MEHANLVAVIRRPVTRAAIGLLAASALLGSAACSSDSSTGPKKIQPGLYALMQVDQKPIPVEIFRGQYYDREWDESYMLVLKVTGGEIVLDEDGGFHLAVDRMWTSDGYPGQGSLTLDGDYRIENGKIFFDTFDGSGDGSAKDGVISVNLDVGETGTMKQYTFRYVP